MKAIEIADDLYEAILKIATELHQSVQYVVDQILREYMLEHGIELREPSPRS